MRSEYTIKFNFTGGVISPGKLRQLMTIARHNEISHVKFGLRQQLLLQVAAEQYENFLGQIRQAGFESYEVNTTVYPNIMSSYPAEEVFIEKNWLSEGVYKDIFDSFKHKPRLKINICNYNQSFTPLFTGNINWVASTTAHYWYLVLRFPQTNELYYWKNWIYTNDIARLSKLLEHEILHALPPILTSTESKGEWLFGHIENMISVISQPMLVPLKTNGFALPYYEGFNQFQGNRYWLGIYRRTEQFEVRFLEALSNLCLEQRIGQICSTPWKSIIIKGIEAPFRHAWDELLGKYQVNVRHAANELNFQVEDDCEDGLALKRHLIKGLNRDDIRTFGLCIGIKTRSKSEVFCSILVRKHFLFTIGGIGFLALYDILCAKDYNPNERTGKVFSRNNFKWLLNEQLRQAIVTFYNQRQESPVLQKRQHPQERTRVFSNASMPVPQCQCCGYVYDAAVGELVLGITAGTPFHKLPASWSCPICDSESSQFKMVDETTLYAVVD